MRCAGIRGGIKTICYRNELGRIDQITTVTIMFLPEVYINLFQGVCIIMFDVGKMIFTRIREKSFLLLSHELVFRSFRFNDTHVQPIYLKHIIQRGEVRNLFLISPILCDFKSLRRQSSAQKQCISTVTNRNVGYDIIN